MTTTIEAAKRLHVLSVHGHGSLIDVRSPAHLDYDHRLGTWPSLVGWLNAGEDQHGSRVYRAFYSGPYWQRARFTAEFGDPAEAVGWIAGLFREGR